MNTNTSYVALNWAQDDPENKLGIFRAGRFTTVNSGLAAVLSVVLTGSFFALQFFALKPLLAQAPWMDMFVSPLTRTQNLTVVVPIVYLFFWCVAYLFVKSRKIKFQERALDLATVPQQVDFFLYEATAQAVLRRLYDTVDSPGHFILLNRIDRALSSLQNIGGVSDVSSILQSQSENDENQTESSYSRIHGFMWAIPVLGFIGTVLGLSKAIGNFGATIKVSGQGPEALEKIKDSLTDVTGGLSTAFETTLIALVAALIIQFYLTRVQSKENKFLDDCNDYCHQHVIAKLRFVSTQ